MKIRLLTDVAAPEGHWAYSETYAVPEEMPQELADGLLRTGQAEEAPDEMDALGEFFTASVEVEADEIEKTGIEVPLGEEAELSSDVGASELAVESNEGDDEPVAEPTAETTTPTTRKRRLRRA